MLRTTFARPLVAKTHLGADEGARLGGLALVGLRVRWKGLFRSIALPYLPRHLLIGLPIGLFRATRVVEPICASGRFSAASGTGVLSALW